MHKFSEKLVEDFVTRHRDQRVRYRQSVKALKASYLSDFERSMVKRFVETHEENHKRYLKIKQFGKPFGMMQLHYAVRRYFLPGGGFGPLFFA